MKLRFPSLREIIDLFLSTKDTNAALAWIDTAVARAEAAASNQFAAASDYFDKQSKASAVAAAHGAAAYKAQADAERAVRVTARLKDIAA
jgi:hypothetical protein